MALEPSEVPCRWAAGALRCPAPATLARGLGYAQKRFCLHHQGVRDKQQGDFIMQELLAGRVPPVRKPPAEFLRLKASLNEDDQVVGKVASKPRSLPVFEPMLHAADEPLFAEAVAIGRGRYQALRQAGVPGDVAIDQAFFAVANWEVDDDGLC